MMKNTLTTLGLWLIATLYFPVSGSTPTSPISSAPGGFVENRGQIKNQCDEPTPEVRYLYHHPAGMNVQVRNEGLSFDLWRPSAVGYEFHRLDLQLVGANRRAPITGREPLDERMNDYRNGQGIEDIPSYARIEYQDIYPDVDLVVDRGAEGGVKYDFELGAAADASDIVLEYSGFDGFHIEDGELVFDMSGRALRERIPASWKSAGGEPVAVEYRVLFAGENCVQIGFATEEEVEGCAWVIDPLIELEWSTYYGGELSDAGEAIATDSLGNVFIAGTTASVASIASEGAYRHEYLDGASDAFLLKLNQHGLRHWCTYYGGSDEDRGLGVNADHFESVYLVGSTRSSDLLLADSSLVRYQDSLRGPQDGFVARFDRKGLLVWDSYVGGGAEDEVKDCHSDAEQGVVLLGTTEGSDVFDTTVVVTSGEPGAGFNLFMASFTNQGEIRAGGYLGGENDERAARLRPGPDGHFIAATTSSPNLPANNGFQSDLQGASDGYLAFVDTSFSVLWASYLGGEGADTLTDVQSDSNGETLYVCGFTDSTSAYADTSSQQIEFGGATDGFVAQILPDGSMGWFTYVGGMNADAAVSLDVDMDTTVYVLGRTYSEQGIVFFDEDSIESDYAGGGDAFVIAYDGEGARQWSTYYGGWGEELPKGLAVHGRTGVFFTGSTNTPDSLAVAEGFEPEPHQDVYGGGITDGFIARITGPKSTPPPVICCNCNDWDEGSYGGTGGGSGGGSGGSGYQPIGICAGDSMRLSAAGGCLSPGSQFVWYADSCGGTDNFVGDGFSVYVSPMQQTTYYVRAEGIDEQTSCVGITIHVDQPITVTATAQDSVCPGESVVLSAEGASNYYWTGPQDFYADGATVTIDTATAANEGEYTVYGRSQFGCEDTATVDVDLLPGPDFEVNATDPLCIDDQNGSIQITGNDTTITEYYWPDIGVDTTYRDSLPAGAYPLTATNIYGCSSFTLVELTEPEWPIDSLITTSDTCRQGMGSALVDLTGSLSDFDVSWSSGIDSEGVLANGVLAGSYTVTVTDTNGCTYESSFTIGSTGEFNAVIAPDSVYLEFDATTVLEVYDSPPQDVESYSWIPDHGLSCSDCAAPVFDPDSTLWYTATITATNGCVSSDSVHVEREVPPPGHFIPTMFSPNNDGLNDELCILGNRILTAHLSIYTREGEKVFEASDLQKCWDGKRNGEPVIGTVIYTFEATLEEGKTVNETGQITLLR